VTVGQHAVSGLRRLAGVWWSLVALVAVWLGWVWLGDVPRVVAPRPTEVVLELARPGWLLSALLSTLWLTLLGAVLGLTAGTLLGVVCWWFSLARPLIMTPAVLAQVVPVVVFIPILGRLVGFGTPSVVAIAVLSGFFPSLVFVDSGLSSVPRAREELVQLLGASRFRYLFHVALPTSVPGSPSRSS
jgi:ABC-type nitrate/sulfonate/bicarbonate transport system permease component